MDPDGPERTRTDPDGPRQTRMDLDVLDRPRCTGRTWTDPDGLLDSAGFHQVNSLEKFTDIFNDRLLGAILQLVPGCYTLAA